MYVNLLQLYYHVVGLHQSNIAHKTSAPIGDIGDCCPREPLTDKRMKMERWMDRYLFLNLLNSQIGHRIVGLILYAHQFIKLSGRWMLGHALAEHVMLVDDNHRETRTMSKSQLFSSISNLQLKTNFKQHNEAVDFC